ncbi:hypothetical protein [Dyadobacter fanqingshengii]|uniref:hypothetical protein n=1 Tax=Dyadobacter fanqingshengii TaxID=2906443 RepID=UPI0020C1930B|nr:hypothetical protein [Dyadobacter fanqingshengii]UTM21845.1 hypothetical protein NFI81_26255 [Dyadobacter fanqingshengii]
MITNKQAGCCPISVAVFAGISMLLLAFMWSAIFYVVRQTESVGRIPAKTEPPKGA